MAVGAAVCYPLTPDMTDNHSDDDHPTWTAAGFRIGVMMMLPVLPGILAFAMVVGATSARKGLSLAETVLMNATVFAGMSQLVAFEAWPERVTLSAMAALALITATVNARMLLMGASLQPWLGTLPAWQVYPTLHIVTDVGWLVTMRYRADGGNDAAVLLGSGTLLMLGWLAATSAGYLAGTLIADPRAIALDLVFPVFFATMLVPLWGSARRTLGWIVAGAVALAAQRMLGGWWFIAIGALTGAVVEGWSDDCD
jgi:predicted branched-subunit amino acid permease